MVGVYLNLKSKIIFTVPDSLLYCDFICFYFGTSVIVPPIPFPPIITATSLAGEEEIIKKNMKQS